MPPRMAVNLPNAPQVAAQPPVRAAAPAGVAKPGCVLAQTFFALIGFLFVNQPFSNWPVGSLLRCYSRISKDPRMPVRSSAICGPTTSQCSRSCMHRSWNHPASWDTLLCWKFVNDVQNVEDPLFSNKHVQIAFSVLGHI